MQLRKRKITPKVFLDFEEPIRAELFSAAHLERYAEIMAMNNVATSRPSKGVNLRARVAECEEVLIASYQAIVETVSLERAIVPAAEWLIDNFYIVEEQLKDIRDHLPPEYYKELPKLIVGKFIGFPRVYAIARDFVAHTDSHFDPELLKLVLKSYQKIQPLTMGELWAIAITLRVVMIENLRYLSARIVGSQLARVEADHIADELLGLGKTNRRSDDEIIAGLNLLPLQKEFAVQLIQRLRFQEGEVANVFKWLEKRLANDGLVSENIVQEEHTNQTTTNITVRNIINSMRLMSSLDWRDFFEDVSLVNDKLEDHPLYGQMDFKTRDIYRHSLEELSRGSKLSELEVASILIKKIEREMSLVTDQSNVMNERRTDIGYYLISSGRYEFEKDIHFKVKLRKRFFRWYVAHREFFYIGGIFSVTIILALSCFFFSEGSSFSLNVLIGLLSLFPASELAITIVNRLTILVLGPRHLPRLDFSRNLPRNLKTFVVVPTMLTRGDDIINQVEQLEVHYLSNPDDSVYFALLSDWKDSTTEHLPTDEQFMEIAQKQINFLNEKYGKTPIGKKRFFLFHRFRKWNESEQKWIGWERKRGKIQEFNRFLRGATDTSFINALDLQLDIPKDIVYVITLDADTKMPKGAVAQLVGTLAHPLNQAKFDTLLNRVVEGFGILQPRITPTLQAVNESTFYQRLSSGPCGIDPYASAVSDVYQDLFGEGSYTGKGIYHVDTFEQALKGRTPENRLLSHDLYEGNFARCGLLSDVEFFEDFPSNFEVAVARNHRWIRGDWQLLPWVMGRGGRALSLVGRWKMIDNLRRSLLNPMIFFLFILLFLAPNQNITPWGILCFLSLSIPHQLPIFEGIMNLRKKRSLGVHLRSLPDDFLMGISRFFLNVIFIPYHSWVQLDAIFRTLWRLGFSKRKLLEWTTSAQSKINTSVNFWGFVFRMAKVQLALIVLSLIIFWINSTQIVHFIPTLVLWMVSPIVAWKISLPNVNENVDTLKPEDVLILRDSARKIWRFFSTFVTEEESFLPPDNFQEDPFPEIAHRSSPTNFGLYLMSTVTARDFGWIGLHEMIERLESTLKSMQDLPRYNGHFYNWYETTQKVALEPRYISSVDNGNLAGHLIAIAQSCEEMAKEADYSSKILLGIEDSVRLLVKSFSLQNNFFTARPALNELINCLETPYKQVLDKKNYWDNLLEKLTIFLDEINLQSEKNEVQNWAKVLEAEIKSHSRDFLIFDFENGLSRETNETEREELKKRLIELGVLSRELVYEMDFSFLYDSTRKLFSIGYRMSDSALDDSYYDLLASEARLLSFVAIAKGDISVNHWFRLGRSLAYVEKGTALISWSGSMFEYLMPSLVMDAPSSSLLERTCQLIVKKQIAYGEEKAIPWGMSESAYSTRDRHLTYQYSNFGVPELAFKRGVGNNLVIAPYATILAGMYDSVSAVKNLKRLSLLNAEGPYGFYESIDFTKSRLPENVDWVIVKTYMAHHQGMSLVSISNIIHNNLMVKRFHREAIVLACELLLQERTPRNITLPRKRMESVKVDHTNDFGDYSLRKYFSPHHRVPRSHLLSSGEYSVMITSAGSGQSSYKDLSVTRWREDVTCDNWGSYIFLRDIHSRYVWSAGHQPTCVDADMYEVVFAEDRAQITREDNFIKTHLEVFISPEDHAEIRRVSLSNNGPEVRVIEVTTYSEVVLNTQAADLAHPVFSNLFVQTEYVPEITSLLATRRQRSEKDPSVWMAQVITLDENVIGDIEYETDRARFIGRGRSIRNPLSIESKTLSNTTGSVLDPIISFRTRVRIEPGATATITYSTVIASTRESVINLAEKFQETFFYERSSNLAWTDAQIKLHYLGIDYGEANLFQQLANRVLFLDSSLRVSSDLLKRNVRNVTSLWAYGISGDYPIVLVRINDIGQRNLVRQLLRAHEYWGTKRLIVDLVILNEKANSYIQELQNDLESMVKLSSLSSGSYLPQSKGKVFLVRADILPLDDQHLLQTAARAILDGRLGGLAEQVRRMIVKIEKNSTPREVKFTEAMRLLPSMLKPQLNFDHGLGGFTDEGLEYVIHLKKKETTPAPWINVVAQPQFGFHVSESGAGSTWSMNSRENQLSPWTNDPISDPIGECFYFYDQDSYELWSPTLSPIRVENAEYLITHGQGYSQFQLRHIGIHSTLTQFVPIELPVKISKLTFKNELNTTRRLRITSYVNWVLGFSKSRTAPYLITDYDKLSNILTCTNPWNEEYGKRVAFASFIGGNDSWTGNRTEFIGRNGSLGKPQALFRNEKLSGNVGAGVDACAGLNKDITVAANGETTIFFVLGQAENIELVQQLIAELNRIQINDLLVEVVADWDKILGKIKVETPDLAMNFMLNRWLLYQTIVCRIWARSAFYQAGGAFGFRDQLQDSMAVIWTKPEMIKELILRAASRQFVEGDVQHWWFQLTGRGVRTHFSDDLLWLPFVVSHYLKITEDYSLLDIEISFLKGPLLNLDLEDSYYTPDVTIEKASIYEHCARALDHSLKLGVHGLPLMGGGDWNDGMNRVGHKGQGESVWLAWFLICNLAEFEAIAKSRGEDIRSENWTFHKHALRKVIDEQAWDGEWYKRAYYDDGTPLGSAINHECRIDSLAQSWSVIAKSENRLKSEQAMKSVEKYLVKDSKNLILLFTPPFNKTLMDPGYIKGYLPGVRENGGQYTHAAIWCIQAYAGLHNGKRAVEIFSMLNPINHSLTLDDINCYKVEPYVIAADIYSEEPHVGRGGWTWYTGSSGWMYTTGIESILGFKLKGNKLRIDPCIHPQWKSYKVIYRYLKTTYEIEVFNPKGLASGASKMSLDGNAIDKNLSFVELKDDGYLHKIIVDLI
jgi:cyclic beta-1,2-glucan synthetase